MPFRRNPPFIIGGHDTRTFAQAGDQFCNGGGIPGFASFYHQLAARLGKRLLFCSDGGGLRFGGAGTGRHDLFPRRVHLLPQGIKRTSVCNDDICDRYFCALSRLHVNAFCCLGVVHAALAHQSFHLDFFRGIRDPNGIAHITQIAFEQFDRFNYNDRLDGSFDKHFRCLTHQRVGDIFQLRHSFRIIEDKIAKLAAVDLAIFVDQPFAKIINHLLITWRAFGISAMGERVCINGISAEMFQHATYHAFSSGDIASETDHKFAGPIAHNVSSLSG
jgi:hypothetical protein